VRNVIDSIFDPASRFFDSAFVYLHRFSIEKNRPIDLDSFFAPFAMMGSSWVLLIKAVFVSLLAVTGLFVATVIRDLYLQFKSGVKWW
jgi:hypothetical protein